MSYREKELTGQISAVNMSAALSASTEMSGMLKQAERVVEKDYEKLINRPSINGVELIKDKTFEDLGMSELTALDVYKILENVWEGN